VEIKRGVVALEDADGGVLCCDHFFEGRLHEL
jgi:hypothetical protein